MSDGPGQGSPLPIGNGYMTGQTVQLNGGMNFL